MKKLVLVSFLICFFIDFHKSFSQTSPSPTTQASNVQITGRTNTTLTASWTRGNGSRCLVTIRPATNNITLPADGCNNSYTASTTYASGANLGNTNYVVYDGTGTSVTVTGLAAATQYRITVLEYNATVICSIFPTTDYHYNYYTINYVSDAEYTLAHPPTFTPGSAVISNIGYTTATCSWSAGNGANDIAVCKENAVAFAYNPIDGVEYVGNSVFGLGANVGTVVYPNYSMYSGPNTSVAMSGLKSATTYSMRVHTYNGSAIGNTFNYLTVSQNNSVSFTTLNYPPTINAISNISICQDAAQQSITLSGISDGSTGETQTVSITATSSNATIFPSSNISVSYTNPNTTGTLFLTPAPGTSGTATITVTVNDNFTTTNTTTNTFVVTVDPKPSAAGAIASSNAFCGGNSASFGVSPIANTTTYAWQFPSTFTVTAGNNTSSITVSTPTVSTITNYTIQMTPTNACGTGTKATKTIQIDPRPTTSSAGPDQNPLCTSTAFLNGNAVTSPNNGQWVWISGTPTPSIGSSTANSTSISGLSSPNTYKYQWVINYTGSSCPASRDTVIITTDFSNPICQPAANFSFSPTSDVGTSYVCKGTNVGFTDLSVSANSWSWDFNYNGSTPNFTSTSQNPTQLFNTVGTFTVFLRIFSNATSQFYTTQKTINVIEAPVAPGLIFGTTNGICAGDNNQYVYSISTVANATNYNWSVLSGASIVANPSATSVAVVYGTLSQPGNISVSASNSCGTSAASSLAINLTPLPAAAGPILGPDTVCQGQNATTYGLSPIANATSYQWTSIAGNSSTTTNPVRNYSFGQNAQSGTIWVKGVNSCGVGDSSSLAITVNPLPGNAGAISANTNLNLCPAPTAENLSIAPVNYASSYNWLMSNGTIVSGQGTNAIVADFSGISSTIHAIVIPSNACGVRDSSSILTVNFNPVPSAQICVVTVDTLSLRNEIYWEHPVESGIDSFRVYRRLTALTDTLVGTSGVEDPGFMVDMLNDYNPNTNSEEYTITVIDSCGNESAKAPYHKTMFLSTSLGVNAINLNWNLYVGNTVNFYRVYRDTTGLGGTNWELLDGSVPPAVTTWVDNNPPSTPQGQNSIRYIVDVDWLSTCDPARGAINTTRSNIKTNSYTGINEVLNSASFTVFPNPAKNEIKLKSNAISYENLSGSYLTIQDALGRTVLTEKINEKTLEITLDIQNLESGIYFLNIHNEKGKVTLRFVVE